MLKLTKAIVVREKLSSHSTPGKRQILDHYQDQILCIIQISFLVSTLIISIFLYAFFCIHVILIRVFCPFVRL